MISSLKQKAVIFLARLLVKNQSSQSVLRKVPAVSEVKVLSIVKLDAIGDFILSTGLLRILAEQFPNITVNLVVYGPLGDLARQQFPQWNIVELTRRKSSWRTVFPGVEYRNILRKLGHSDMLLDLRTFRNYNDTVVSSWVSASYKICVQNAHRQNPLSYSLPNESLIYNTLISSNDLMNGESEDLAHYRYIAGAILGNQYASHPILPSLRSDSEAKDGTSKIIYKHFGISLNEPYYVVCPGTSSVMREYPTDKLASALISVFGERSKIPIVIGGSSLDARTTFPLSKAFPPGFKIADATGILSLREHIALIAGAKLVIAMETSHAHIAGAVNTPCVAVIGGGHYGKFAPWGIDSNIFWVNKTMDCYGCNWKCIFEKPRCIVDISVQTLASAIRSMISRLS